jgi:hypothetical protein
VFLRAARPRELSAENRRQLEDVIALGERCVEMAPRVLHGEVSGDDVGDQLVADMRRFSEQQLPMVMPGGIAEFDLELAGSGVWHADDMNFLWAEGRHAHGEIVAVVDTQNTVNERPMLRVTIRVTPDGEPPFEIKHTKSYSRAEPPRKGESVEVAFDPDDQSRFTFRLPDLTDDVVSAPAQPRDPVEELERLAKLHDAGALTDEEFAAQKTKLLERM